MPLELDYCVVLREVHIYSGSPLKTLGQGGYTDKGGLTARRPIRLLAATRGGKPKQPQVLPWWITNG
jgi:hypothetical protein